MSPILDLYIDYLQVVYLGLATATGLSKIMDYKVSHDQITRMLTKSDYTNKTLWKYVKPLIRKYESKEGCLIIDDSILPKPYTDENEVVGWFYDHTHHQTIKGMNLLTALYYTQTEEVCLRVPVSFKLIEKYPCCDRTTQKEIRRSNENKNELMRAMVKQAIQNGILFHYVLADAWFACNETMKWIHAQKKSFILEVKSNRLVTQEDRNKAHWQRLDDLSLPPDTPTQVWLKDLVIPVLLIKQVLTNKDGSVQTRYLVSNELSLTREDFLQIYHKRWSVEEFYKSLKQNTGVTRSPTRTVKTQSNHVFASILAYVKFERYKLSMFINHFALKAKLYAQAYKVAFAELRRMKSLYLCEEVPMS